MTFRVGTGAVRPHVTMSRIGWGGAGGLEEENESGSGHWVGTSV